MKPKKTKWIFLIISLLFLLFFLYIKISPLGSWSCSSKFNNFNHLFFGRGCFSQPSPSDRYIKEKNIKMIGDPLYFSLYSPRNFDKLNLEIEFKTNLDKSSPVVEAGLLVNRDLWHYQLQAVYNYWLEDYESNWQILDKSDDIEKLLDKNCQDIPYNLCLAQYNLDSKQAASLPDFNINGQAEIIEFNVPLRGHHSFFIYLDKDDDFKLEIEAKDLNLNQDKSPINIDIYKDAEIIYNKSFPDDRKEDIGSQQVSDPFLLDIKLEDSPAGLYRIDLQANDDIVFNQLIVNSSILSFRHRLWIYSDFLEKLDLVTDSRVLQIKVQDPSAYQDIKFSQQKFELDELYRQYEIISEKKDVEGLYNNISFNGGGLLLEGPGVFALDKDHIFNPNYSRLDRFYQEQAKFILVNYQKLKQLDNGYYLAEIEFDLRGVYRQDNKYNLIISVPGLRVEDEIDNYIKIKSLRANFSGKSLIDKINEF